jgi:hypothetical protein
MIPRETKLNRHMPKRTEKTGLCSELQRRGEGSRASLDFFEDIMTLV